MEKVKNLKLLTAIFESILAIPFWGGVLIVNLLWIPLFVMLILHIITLIFSSKHNLSKGGSISGIITSLIGWIPLVGMIGHIITAILLWIDYSKVDDKK